MLLQLLIVGLALAWAVILIASWVGWQLLRQNGRILLRLDELENRLNELELGGTNEPEGLSIGTEAPPIELPDLKGERKSLAQFRGQPALLIFFSPGCGFCREMMPKLAAFARPANTLSHPTGGGQKPLVLIVTAGEAEANRQLFDEHKVGCPVLLQKDAEVATVYQANGTPSGYLIDPEGKIASELTMGAEALLTLASANFIPPATLNSQPAAANGDGRANRFGNRSLARSRIKRDGLKAGAPAPDFRLPRLDGHGDLTLSELRGKRVLLVFSSPDCGPCNTLAPELEKFHCQHSEVQLVMISKGEPKNNRAKVKEHGLTFPVVLQQQWEISRRYAMFATPIAYLIDEAGIIEHDVAAGIDAIRELMSQTEQVASGSRE